MAATILLVEDDLLQRRLLATLLTKKLGYEVIMAQDGREAIDRLQASNIDDISAVLMDIQMPNMDGFEALKAMRRYRPDLPVLMLTGNDDTAIAVKSIKEGASDFLVKPPDPLHLDVAIRNAIRMSSLSRELAKLKRDKEGALSFQDLVGHSAGLADAVALGRRAAASDVPVLLAGETGVGKELFARAIHGESRRAGAPFIAFNCGAVPGALADAALFAPDKGLFRKAEGGSVFLDDVSELSMEGQIKLLRLLQHRELESAAGKALRVNVRLISATDRDLAREVQEGRFREDLYFRLNILPITLPPLRERAQDIVQIAEYFIEHLGIAEGLAAKTLTREAKQYLMRHPWPGNVREMENIIHRSMVLAEGDTIDAGLLLRVHQASGALQAVVERRSAPALHVGLRRVDGTFKTMDDIEQEAMRMALDHFGQNIALAAQHLGMAKSTFYRKLKTAQGQ